MNKETYKALEMACELRQIIADITGDKGLPHLGISKHSYPIPPFENEEFESACRRIFGDYVYSKIHAAHEFAERGLPERYKRKTG